MQFTALEAWIIRTAIANSAAQTVGDLMARGRLLEMMEFTDAERAAIGWRVTVAADGSESPTFGAEAVVERNLSDRQVARLRAILVEMAPTFRVQVYKQIESALLKLGWVPTGDDE